MGRPNRHPSPDLLVQADILLRHEKQSKKHPMPGKKVSAMKRFNYVGLAACFIVLLGWSGLAQSLGPSFTIKTYAGPPLPVSGAQATAQAIDGTVSVVQDGVGG